MILYGDQKGPPFCQKKGNKRGRKNRVASLFIFEIPVYSSIFSSIFFRFQYRCESKSQYIPVYAEFEYVNFKYIPVYHHSFSIKGTYLEETPFLFLPSNLNKSVMSSPNFSYLSKTDTSVRQMSSCSPYVRLSANCPPTLSPN